MKNTYTIPEALREDVSKKLAGKMKKAQKYGAPLIVTYGEPYYKEIPVMVKDPVTHTIGKDGAEWHEVFDLTIESEIIKKDGYSIIAKIEHFDEGNVVSPAPGINHRPEWSKIPAHCDHCNGNHGQKITFIVRNDNGDEKQVGRTCLKDYCGIDPQAIGMANELIEIVEDLQADRCDFHALGIRQATDIVDALALAILILKQQGYRRSDEQDSNKQRLRDMLSKNEHASEDCYKEAEEIVKTLCEMDQDTAIAYGLDNIWTFAKCGFCKHTHYGYVAYAPVGFKRYLEKKAEKEAREQEKNSERNASEYVGEIGQKMVVDIKDFRLLTSWETQYGITYLYKFTDVSGNILIWKASQLFGAWVTVPNTDYQEWKEYDHCEKLRVTVKDHNERDGVKQTIVTRCKLVA